MRPSRGVTLLELLVALVVTAFAISGALLMVQAQQRVFYSGAKTRQAQQNARSALLFLEQKVPLAGYGIDPAEALDFAWYCPTGSCTRDSTNGPDELVFYARNPAFQVVESTSPPTFYGKAWQVNSVTSSTLSLEARGGENFLKGQIVQILCKNELRFTHVTLAQTHWNVPAGPVELELAPATSSLSPNVPANPFTRQDAADGTNPAFTKTGGCLRLNPRAFLVDRYRLYVRPVDVGGGRFDPYLVLDMGVDTDGSREVDQDDEILIAEGIENLQVAYSFIDPTIPTAGNVPGTPISVPPAGSLPSTLPQTITPTNFPGDYASTQNADRYPFLASSQLLYTSGTPLHDKRRTNDQGNIRAIKIALVARSPDPDPSARSNLRYEPGSPLWVMNFNQLPAWIANYLALNANDDHYLRTVLTTTVYVPNLAARALASN